MKDVEFGSQLLLFLDEGVRGYSQDDLDQAYSERDVEWESRERIEEEFRNTIEIIDELARSKDGTDLMRTRLKNQADFYSLFAAIATLRRSRATINIDMAARALIEFIGKVELVDPTKKQDEVDPARYYEAARSASNDFTPRTTRIEILDRILSSAIST